VPQLYCGTNIEGQKMSRSYRVLSEKAYAYFVTCTIVEWLPVFSRDEYRQIALDSLAHMRQHKNVQLNAFVVMPTHLHAVIFPNEGTILSDVLRDFKRFTSRAISSKAIELNDSHFLETFAAAREQNRAQDVSQFQVWQEGSHPEAIYTLTFAKQKIDYIHRNPVKAGLAISPETWQYSSARAYLVGDETYPVTDLLSL
jgi:REP element-mobilizing transposase RayT